MRWILVTPTFAAGLGVVIAAAVGSPAPSVVLSTTPYFGTPCKVEGCGSGNGKGTLATRPGTRRLVNTPRKHSGGQAGSGQSSSAAGRFLVDYRTVRQNWGGDFIGEIILASRAGQPLGSWTLTFTYPSGQIQAVWGGAQIAHGVHTVTVSSRQYQGGWSGSQQAQVMFAVSGPPGRPASCTINGSPCQYTTVLGGEAATGGWGAHSQASPSGQAS